jgi:hypothetical protein
MSEAQNNVAVLNRKEWQTMMPTPVTTAAGYFVVNDNANVHRLAMYMNLAATPYLYDHEQDDWLPITASGLAPAVAAGACGCFTDWSITLTANGGSTSTIQVAAATHNINGLVVGKTVEFKSGNNIGLRRTITKILTLGTGNIVLTFDSVVGTAVANNDTFRIASGSFWILTTGTLTTTSFKGDYRTSGLGNRRKDGISWDDWGYLRQWNWCGNEQHNEFRLYGKDMDC